MQTGFGQICINPTQPTEAAGFIQQRNVKLTDVHDDLYARILGVRDDSTTLFLVSLDNLGTPYRLEEELTRQYAQETGEQAVVQISCTHDHFAANVEDEDYYRLLKERIFIGCKELVWHTSDLRLSRRHIYFDEVGHSRITGHKAKNIYLDLVCFYDGDLPLGTAIIYNCHPTILSGFTPYFSGEYPGYVLRRLQERYPAEFFTFFQGAAGDISTRFTRTRQDYEGVVALGDKLVKKIVELKEAPMETHAVSLRYEKRILPLEHEYKDLDEMPIPPGISAREKAEIDVAKRIRKEALQHPERLERQLVFSKVDFGFLNMIFTPKEMFSAYMDALDLSRSILVGYTNGYSPYIVELGHKELTYEMCLDTTKETTKERFYELLHELSTESSPSCL